jgi:hypothetical protein
MRTNILTDYWRACVFRLFWNGISLLEFGGVSDCRSLLYISYNRIEGFDFSILWLRKHGKGLFAGFLLFWMTHVPFEGEFRKRFRFYFA